MNDDAQIKILAEAVLDNTYIMDDCEVKPTGRYAAKLVGKDTGRRTQRIQIKHEVTPVDPDVNWKQWVIINELFRVQEENK